MKIVASWKYSFCSLYNETIIHLFHEYTCIRVMVLYNILEKNDENVKKMNCKEVILGFDLAKISPVSLIVDNVILHVKMYLWKCKCFSIDPSYQNFKTFIEN